MQTSEVYVYNNKVSKGCNKTWTSVELQSIIKQNQT